MGIIVPDICRKSLYTKKFIIRPTIFLWKPDKWDVAEERRKNHSSELGCRNQETR